jgi:hypothetical protein
LRALRGYSHQVDRTETIRQLSRERRHSNTAAIGTLASVTKTPISTADPPSNSVSMVAQAMTCGIGTCNAARIAANASGPFDSLE